MEVLKKAQADGVLVGLKDVAGVVPRLDVDLLLLNEPDTFNLFLLALQSLQSEKGSEDKMGYFQIAGIHGLPMELWDDVAAGKDTSQAPGYCAHATTIFPTWHRPYLAMMEQTIYSKILEIAETFPNPQKYRDAAQKFRLPYWDYYRPRGNKVGFPGVRLGGGRTTFNYDFSIPQIMALDQVMIRTPEKDELELKVNPMKTFNFPTTGSIPEEEWDILGLDAASFSRKRTVRYPTSSKPLDGDLNQLNQVLNSQRESNTGLILNMISDDVYNVYEEFATDSANEGPSGSLEGIHNDYHGLIGGGGHMSRVPIAAFDPVFWMHHCNIDRWLAIWQASHPNGWFSDSGLENAPLYPFRLTRDQDGDTFWTSDQSRSTTTFGYTYPDIQGISDPDQVKALFETHYEWSRRTPTQNYKDPPKDMKPLDLSLAQVYQYKQQTQLDTIPNIPIHGQKLINRQVKTLAKTTASALESFNVSTTSLNDAAKSSVHDAANGNARVGSEGTRPQDSHTPTESPSKPPKTSESKLDRDDKESFEWYIDDVVERLALDGSFTIYYFLGAPPTSPGDYPLSPHLAGTTHIFAAPTAACDHCGRQEQQAKLVAHTTAITSLLLDYVEIGELEDLNPEHVKRFLVEKLDWKVLTVNGLPIPPSTVRGLKISVSCKVIPLPQGSGPVRYERFPDVVEEIERRDG